MPRSCRRVVSCILVVGALAWASRASADDRKPHAAPADGALKSPAELLNRPRSGFEEALMRELACTCGTCELEPIVSCRCDDAAELRGEVCAELDKLDLSTAEGRARAAKTVRATLIARHGPKILGHDVDANGHFAEVLVGSGLALSVLFFALFRRLRRPEGSEVLPEVVGRSPEHGDRGGG